MSRPAPNEAAAGTNGRPGVDLRAQSVDAVLSSVATDQMADLEDGVNVMRDELIGLAVMPRMWSRQ